MRAYQAVGQGDGDDHVAKAGAQQGDEEECQYQRGEGHEHVAQAHQQQVGAPADEPGHAADREPKRQHQRQGQHHAAQGQARADDQPRKQVAPEVVGAQPVAGVGRLQALAEVDQVGVMRGNPMAEQRQRCQQADQGQADHQAGAAQQQWLGQGRLHTHAFTPSSRLRGSSQA